MQFNVLHWHLLKQSEIHWSRKTALLWNTLIYNDLQSYNWLEKIIPENSGWRR